MFINFKRYNLSLLIQHNLQSLVIQWLQKFDKVSHLGSPVLNKVLKI